MEDTIKSKLSFCSAVSLLLLIGCSTALSQTTEITASTVVPIPGAQFQTATRVAY